MQSDQLQSAMPLMSINSQVSEGILPISESPLNSINANGKRNSNHLNGTKFTGGPDVADGSLINNNTIINGKKMKLNSEFTNENGENFDSQLTTNGISNGNGSKVAGATKKPTDLDMAYNIFVRRVVDDTLDRTVTFCEQPKDIISNLEDICSTAFPSLEKNRHRIKIRGYLKACRRNSKKHNGKVSMKDTPSHMCSEKAFAMANEALTKVNKELQILKLAKLGRAENTDSNSQGNSSDDGRPDIDTKSLECNIDNDSSLSNSDLSYFKNPIMPQCENDPFSSAFSGLMPPLYGILPPPPLFPNPIPGLPGRGCTPPPAHCNSFQSSLHNILSSNPQQTGSSLLLEKMLHCTSIDPDFGIELLRNKVAAQEAINSMRIMARFMLNRSLMVESYLIREMHKCSSFYPSDDL